MSRLGDTFRRSGQARLLIGLLGWFTVCPAGRAQGEAQVTPLPRAHAHNDYAQARPLRDALAQGFCSVEADLFLVEGRLLVAHDAWAVKPERTLETLYLEPLKTRVLANGGRVFRNGPAFHLLIDLKTDGPKTYAVLREVLARYREMLTRFRPEATETNAVTVILSGNSPRELLATEAVRYAAIDGRLADLETQASQHLVPWISDNWLRHFRWRGADPMPADEREKLRSMVAKAHAQGRKVRFWGGPDIPALWRAQWEAGVDLVNTDKLAELRAFLGEAGR